MSTGAVAVYRCRDRTEADTMSLVLSSVGIPYRVEHHGSSWFLLVDEAWYDSAARAVAAQLEELSESSDEPRSYWKPTGRSVSGVWVALAILVLHIVLVVGDQWQFVVARFGCSAAAVMDGELFRCVTSLFLHSDVLHVVGNSVGLALFGSAVARQTGYGVGWLLMLFSGAIGNLVNAWLHRAQHSSIGASTLVFGAVGALVVLRLVREKAVRKRWRGMLIPIGGGLALLGMLGSGGEHTDLLAHLLGFVAGVLLAVGFTLSVKRGRTPGHQPLFLASGLAIVVLSWLQLIRI